MSVIQSGFSGRRALETVQNTLVTTPGVPVYDALRESFSFNTAGQVVVNGVSDGTTSAVTQVLYYNHLVYQFNGTNWYSRANAAAAWSAAGGDPRGSFSPGTVLWGVNGHRDQGGIYTTRTLAQQIADIQNIFGSVSNKVLYRAWGVDGNFDTDIRQCQTAGIIPIYIATAYPGFAGFTSESDAYTKTYNIVASDISSNPTVTIWEIGNEFDINGPIFAQWQAGGSTGNLASDWTGLASYPLYRGATAGAAAAIRDNAPNASIIGGALSGWTRFGLELALATDLSSYTPQSGRNLMWDTSVMHFYNDAGSGGNSMGDPASFASGSPGGPFNIYTALNSTGKPLIFTEFGASDINNATNDAQAATNLTTLMASFKSHTTASGTIRGTVGACIYQLYQQSTQTDYFLYTISGSTATISAQGTAVKNWIAANP